MVQNFAKCLSVIRGNDIEFKLLCLVLTIAEKSGGARARV